MTSTFVQTRYGNVHLLRNDGGDLATVLCLHGEGKNASSRVWEPFVKSDFAGTIYALDMPGYGKSDGDRKLSKAEPTQIITEVLRCLDIRSVTLIGRAVGGRTAMLCAALMSSKFKVRSLILSHPVKCPDETFVEIKRQKIPTFITWAKDDRWGQPFDGPHGAHYFVQKLGCDLHAWEMSDYMDEFEFYRTTYASEVNEFLRTIKITFKIRKRRRARKVPKVQKDEEEVLPKEVLLVQSETSPPEAISKISLVESATTQGDERNQHVKEKVAAPVEIAQPPSSLNEPVERALEINLTDNSKDDVPLQNTTILSEETVEVEISKEDEPSAAEEIGPKIGEIFCETSYGKVHLLTCGPKDGPVFLAMHGDGKNSSNEHWRWILKPLALNGLRVISISMPGYGQSSGKRRAFRSHGKEVCVEIIKGLKLKTPLVLAGRSVGGRTLFEAAVAYPKFFNALIATHPVVPSKSILQAVEQPCLLTWARDDGLRCGNPCLRGADGTQSKKKGGAGHPYYGPHGAAYVVKIVGANLLSWNEADYESNGDFYETTYCERVVSFLKVKKILPREKS